MNKTKEILITGFALFSLFFGAGNLLIPPLLGYNAGGDWLWVSIGFMLTAVVIPILGILAHARLQGTMYDFAKKVSPLFSIVYCILVYAISIAIPSPRTAAATHEMAIFPLFGTSPLLTSSIYFGLVLLFVLNRAKILNVIGKYLTPLIVLILLLVIGVGLFASDVQMNSSTFEMPLVSGMLEGYQTFDAIGAVVVGGVLIISLNLKGHTARTEKRELIKKAGLIAGVGLFVIYAGLISVGAFYGKEILIDSAASSDMQRANLLRGISIATLGRIGTVFFSVLLALACFTTAVGIVTGTADYFKGLFNNSQKAYVVTAIIGSLIGIAIGQLNFHSIIVIAYPVLLFIYPITIVLILLNVLPEKFAGAQVFRTVVVVTFLFSIPDVLGFVAPTLQIDPIVNLIPFAKQSLGWVVPAFVTFVIMNVVKRK